MLSNIPEFSVSEFSRSIKRVVEDAFGYIRIRGEISGLKKASSGHLYFSLKDETSLISAVCFRNAASQINFPLGDGLEVVASGQVTTYEGRSNYQIIVDKIEIAGIGALLQAIEKRKQKLLEEGLFDAIHKKPLPFWPAVIGVITSPTGAVIEDIIHRISARFPTQILLYPVVVQGKTAAAEVIAGIKYFNNKKNTIRPDVIIVARGGGSFEDLLPFNDEDLVRAVFKSEIPIVSAVGHETDTTLIDLVSDLRAPTPTAAAELVTPVLAELRNVVLGLEKRLNNYLDNSLLEKKNKLENYSKRLIHPSNLLDDKIAKLQNLEFQIKTSLIHNLKIKEQSFKSLSGLIARPLEKIENYDHKLEFLAKNLAIVLVSALKSKQHQINLAEKLLDSYDYHQVLKRGFALVKDGNGHLISEVEMVRNNQMLEVEVSNGKFRTVAISDSKNYSKKINNNPDNLLF